MVEGLLSKTLGGVEPLCSEAPMMTCLDSSSSCCREPLDERTSAWWERERSGQETEGDPQGDVNKHLHF